MKYQIVEHIRVIFEVESDNAQDAYERFKVGTFKDHYVSNNCEVEVWKGNHLVYRVAKD